MSLNRDLSTISEAPSKWEETEPSGTEHRTCHPWETKQWEAVCALRLNGPEPAFDHIASRAAEICETPMGLVTALRGADQIFLGRFGTELSGTLREESFCAQEIFWGETLVVPDSHVDSRFANLGTVINEPFVRFYAGVPIYAYGGLPVGRVCVIDTYAREMRPDQIAELRRLADLVSLALDARRTMLDLLGPTPSPAAREAALNGLDRALEASLAISKSSTAADRPI